MIMQNNLNRLDITFSALSDPTRRAVLERLLKGDICVTDLAEPFNMSLPAVSKHLKILENAGLVQRRKKGRVHHIQLVAKPMEDAIDWMSRYKGFWEKQLDALENYFNNT